MTDSPEGAPKTSQPSQSAELALPTPDGLAESERDRGRRVEINHLVQQFLGVLNPRRTSEDIKVYSLTDTSDVYSNKPLSEIPGQELTGYRDAISMARFYWENRDTNNWVRVPTQVFVSTGGEMPNLKNNPNEKTLVYINEQEMWEKGKDSSYQFSDKSRWLFSRGERQLPPDVFIKNINHRRPPSGKDTFTVSGCDNLLIRTSFFKINHVNEINLSCQNKCAILPRTVLAGGEYMGRDHTKISIHTDGDIVQYEGSRIAVQDIVCNNYIQNGGTIEQPSPDLTVLQHHGSVTFNAGTHPSEKVFRTKSLSAIDAQPTKFEEGLLIADSGYLPEEVNQSALPTQPASTPEVTTKVPEAPAEIVTSQVETPVARETVAVSELAEDADKDIEARPSSMEELEAAFDAIAEPHARFFRAEESGDFEVRSFVVENWKTEKLAEVEALAAISGWKIVTSSEKTLLVQKKHIPKKPQR